MSAYVKCEEVTGAMPCAFVVGARKSGIYAICNKVTGKVYLGSSGDCVRRYREHSSRLARGVHVNAKLQASWNKHGAEAFEFTMVFTVLDVGDLEGVEQQFLDEHDVVATGYNLAPVAGRTTGWKATPETRARMSAAAKLRDHSVQVAAMAKATRGKKRPQYVLDAMLAGLLAKGVTPETKAKMSASAVARGPYTHDQGKAMAVMFDAGSSYRAVARHFETSHSLVSRYIERYRAEAGA
jgi:group I intron endonuclease